MTFFGGGYIIFMSYKKSLAATIQGEVIITIMSNITLFKISQNNVVDYRKKVFKSIPELSTHVT